MSRNLQKTDKKMVGLGRFELPTHGLGNRCSIHLSYRPVSPDSTCFSVGVEQKSNLNASRCQLSSRLL